MAVIEGGVSGALAGVGAESGSPQHVVTKPDSVGALGHYTTTHRTAMINGQAANSRIFSLQNAHATNLIVIHEVRIVIQQTAAMTAAIETSLDVYKLTGFSVVDTTNTVTPVATKMRTSFGTAGAVLRGLTIAGAAAGMTGGTSTKDTAPILQQPTWLLLAVPTGGPTVRNDYTWSPEVSSGQSPLILVQNEGLLIENRTALGAAAGASVHLRCVWSELTAY